MKLNNKRKLGFISYWRDNKYRVMDLEKFFDDVESDKDAQQQRLKDLALHLLSTSTMKDDDDGLEDEIIDTEPTLERWREIFERLKLNQLRTIDLPNWSQTSFNKSYKDNGVDN
jgi:hypothetical protein|tara:strand:+ start:346 stop:687 length:342 start_codon:yes stop_codon:yes gene_type:complete